MTRLRRVAATGCGVVFPAGVGRESVTRWWEGGRAPTAGPIASLSEAWLPTDQGCEVPGWRGRDHLPDRKAIKLMTRPVQLGVTAALEAWAAAEPEAEEPPPHRRGMYTACGVPADEDWTFRESIEAAIVADRFDLRRFGEVGQGLLNPLWLVKSLTNNVLAFTAKTLDLQGPNNNFEGGAAGALVAVGEAARSVAEGRADVALAGAADSLVSVEALLALARNAPFGGPDAVLPGEGASFLRLEVARPGALEVVGFGTAYAPDLGRGQPRCSPHPDPAISEALAEARVNAWAASADRGTGPEDAIRLSGPRVPLDGSSSGETISLWEGLGDPGAAAGALLLAAAWLIHHRQPGHAPLELSAVSPGGETAVLLLATAD
ncbi:MAG: beta-ketoacyl synthase N-terminal-like domain-containing protein [Myxococcota bacterium]|nr:beta-ketoacyl synthase N-terminal-like domain-containing protein [Myxococcota bacterium]